VIKNTATSNIVEVKQNKKKITVSENKIELYVMEITVCYISYFRRLVIIM
jgi:hypothetical protein